MKTIKEVACERNIRLSEKFLSFYRKIINAQCLFYINIAAHELEDQLSLSYQRIIGDLINESLAILFYDLYTVRASQRI